MRGERKANQARRICPPYRRIQAKVSAVREISRTTRRTFGKQNPK